MIKLMYQRSQLAGSTTTRNLLIGRAVKSWRRKALVSFGAALAVIGPVAMAAPDDFREYPMNLQSMPQVPTQVVLALERDIYAPLDKVGRFVVAMQVDPPVSLDGYEAKWTVTCGGAAVASGGGSLSEGLLVVDFPLKGLGLGLFEVTAEVRQGASQVGEQKRSFEIRADSGPPPATSGRVPLLVDSGVPATPSGYPLTFGVPMPRAALADLAQARVVDAEGNPVPAQFIARSNWAYASEAGVRWLGVDIQSPEAPAWWPDRKATPFFLEFGAGNQNPPPPHALVVETKPDGIHVNTGPLQFLVPSSKFNLLDRVLLNGRPVLNQGGAGGAYLVDQDGAVYRAANDAKPLLKIEEHGPLRTVIRVEGWYVKDGTAGEITNFTLPTDRLCKFITRIEAYAGLPWVRVLHTWINTSDSFSVFFQDVGLSLARPGNVRARFGVEDGKAIETMVGKGVYLLQHLPDAFSVNQEGGKEIVTGKRSNGTVDAVNADGSLLTVSHRETWQRFPKEMEVLPGELRFHVWPAHGRNHPGIDPFSKENYHRLWFAHQGKLLDLRFPWQTLFAVMRFKDDADTTIYKPAGMAMGGVHASAMGTAITSDFMIRFGNVREMVGATQDATAFQQRPLASADPKWLNSSLVLGPVHPYDPERFPAHEKAAEEAQLGIWKLQDETGQFGMYLYRGWHHSSYLGKGFWEPYRLYSAGHHFEPYLPWLYFARSGNPQYARMGLAGMRHLTDLGITHFDDPAYDHSEANVSQKRLVGSTRHTNGFVLWGGDHSPLAHLTSNGAIMLAYYLTGDLRFREVVVDEWQHTILEERRNPEWGGAVSARLRWNEPVVPYVNRDGNHALGETIDLYQLTYDPRLLPFHQMALERMQQNMFPWSVELRNVLLFRRTPKLRQMLIEAAAARREDPKSNLHVCFSAASPAARIALAAFMEPGKGFDRDALFAFNTIAMEDFGESFLDWNRPSEMAFKIPDFFLEMPLIMAVSSPLYDGKDGFALDGPPQLLPIGIEGACEPVTRVIVRENEDGDFTIRLRGRITSPAAWLKVLDGNGKRVYDAAISAGRDSEVTIPKDGFTGDYVLVFSLHWGKDEVQLPVTSLSKEIYAVNRLIQPNSLWHGFFLGAPNTPEGNIRVEPWSSGLSINSLDRTKVLAERHVDEPPAAVEVKFPDGGVWFLTRKGKYFPGPEGSLFLFSLSPERFFLPPQAILGLK